MFKRILVPTDGSDITAKAVDTSIALAKSVGAKLYTISVKEPFPYSAISEMQPTPPQEFFDAQERIAAKRVQAVSELCAPCASECSLPMSCSPPDGGVLPSCPRIQGGPDDTHRSRAPWRGRGWFSLGWPHDG